MVKKYSKLSLMLLTVFVASLLLASLGFAALSNSDLSVTLNGQNPDPVEPGDVVRVEIQVQNNGPTIDGDLIVSVEPSYPLSVYGVDSVNIGRLGSGGFSQSVEFDLLVDSNAIEGDVEFDVFVTRDGQVSAIRRTFTIDVDTYNARLDIADVQLDPMPVLAGNEASLVVTLTNRADSLLKSITATLDFDDDTLPFAPFQSSSEKSIGSLRADESVGLQYKMYVDPSAEPGLYKVPLTLDYSDNAGNSFSSEELVTVLIGSELNVDLQVRDSDIWSGSTTGDVTFEIQNKGLGEIKAVTFSVLDSEDNSYEVLGTQSSFYVGNVDADDTETEAVTLSVSSKEDVPVLIELEYLDSLNEKNVEQFEVMLDVPSKSEAIALGLTTAGGASKFVIFFIVVGLGIWYWRRRKKAQEEEKSSVKSVRSSKKR